MVAFAHQHVSPFESSHFGLHSNFSLCHRFTIRFASPLLIAEELASVQKYSSPTLKSLNLRTRPHTREVLGSYTVEEISIDVSIKLPKNHPIDQVEIDGGKRVGVDAAKWRTWLLQLTAFLAQNGSVLDGLLLWANNLCKRFDGVDECMICFYILHCLNYQLPRVSCRKCRKRFHSACLVSGILKQSIFYINIFLFPHSEQMVQLQ